MERKLVDRIRYSLRAKRDNLTTWLATTAPMERQLRLGPATEAAMKAHLETLDQTLAKAEDQTLGQCQVCNEAIEPALLEMDYACCVCHDHLSSDEVRQLETELEMAGQVQRTLLPHEVPEIPGFDIAAYSRPSQIIGGDYFDFFTFRDHQPGMIIADVAGHGMSASLHMASVQTLLRTLVPANTSPAGVVTEVQRLYSITSASPPLLPCSSPRMMSRLTP
jgi:RNA polymerase-binding transcription factor DksA